MRQQGQSICHRTCSTGGVLSSEEDGVDRASRLVQDEHVAKVKDALIAMRPQIFMRYHAICGHRKNNQLLPVKIIR